jgi:hypothetical protein
MAVGGCLGCGGSDETAQTAARTSANPPPSSRAQRVFVARAESICRKALVEIHGLSGGLPQAIRQSGNPSDPIVGALVEPGIEILTSESNQLRALRLIPDSPALETYLGLFDPIVELAHQRAEIDITVDSNHVRSLELLITELGQEQTQAARELGLKKCAIDFTQALGGAQ